jgi:hypothetical protein
VNTTVRSANAGTATMVAMLNAQAMATALDVYFTGQGYVAANSGRHLPKSNIGSMIMDLTYVCKVGGSCWPSVTSAFGGAQSLSVSDMLVFTSANYKRGGVGGGGGARPPPPPSAFPRGLRSSGS